MYTEAIADIYLWLIAISLASLFPNLLLYVVLLISFSYRQNEFDAYKQLPKENNLAVDWVA